MNKSKKNINRQLSMLLVVLILVAGSARTGYAMLPGESAAIISTMWQINGVQEKTKLSQFLEKLAWAKKEFAELSGYRRTFEDAVSGNWKDPLQILRDEKSRIVAIGRDFKTTGWQVGGDNPELTRTPVIERAGKAFTAIDEMSKSGEAFNSGTLRDSLEDLYEPANATRTGGRSEAAMASMADAISLMGEASDALREQEQILADARKRAEQGNLPDSEVQRLQVVTATAQARAANINTQLQMASTRLQISQLGYQVAAANARDRELLDEKVNRLGAMGALQLKAGMPTVGAVGRDTAGN